MIVNLSPSRLNPSEDKRRRLFSLVVILLLVPVSYAQLKHQEARGDDQAIVTPRKVVIVRRGKLAKDFPDKKTAIVTYPLISGLKGPKVLRRVQSILRVKNVFDYSLAEYGQDAWLEEFSYKVNYNKNSILDITFTQSGSAAYPDTQTKHFAINLKDGSMIKASAVFVPDSLAPLSAMVNRKLQSELKQILKENPSSDAEDKRIVKEAEEVLEFKVENLDDFSVGAKGITFLYDAGYPHVIQAFEPDGRYFFNYAELKRYIKRDGILGQFVQ